MPTQTTDAEGGRGDLFELSDAILRGAVDIAHHHPFSPSNRLVEAADGVAFVESFANVSAFATGDGLCLIDTGSAFAASAVHTAVRSWSPDRLASAVYTHGHVDHVFGTQVFEEESAANGWEPPQVVAHELVDERFDRYVLTAGYNAVINQRQFRAPGLTWPVEYRRADVTYADALGWDVGDLHLELRHARGETDDATWVWAPDQKVLCPGDLIIWCSPNAGNPQKVQRFARDWAVALREMAALEPEILLPGHGLPIRGAAHVQAVLIDTADLLDHVLHHTLDLMNEGATLDAIVHSLEVPSRLAEKPYLQPIYDEPEFVVRNVWRLYGGWYDGNPARLKPPPDAAVGTEVAALAGGAPALAARAREVADAGDLRLACQLVEWAVAADPEDRALHEARAEIYRARVKDERSLMARGVFSWAAHESTQVSEED
jgi:alkyl sulfatase BDS1-like metallo-beta-lactamase superfamily hydrolase